MFKKIARFLLVISVLSLITGCLLHTTPTPGRILIDPDNQANTTSSTASNDNRNI